MKRIPVESSSLASVGYDREISTLEVEFRNGGCYQYFPVPQRVFEQLMAAPSKGA
jgi:ATP-dependent DNA helicase RecG